MQDRFKFRIWDKQWKEMFYIINDNDFLEFNVDYNYQISKYDENGNWRCTIAESDKTILMQCTGLKDKNNKLIYEGDIVRYTEIELDENTEWEKAEVVWGGDYDYPAFDLKDKDFRDFDGMNAFSYLFAQGWTIEVIGNIYENPELLEGKC